MVERSSFTKRKKKMTDTDDPFEVVIRAIECIHRDQDSPDWNPANFTGPWFVVWAVVHSYGIVENGGLRYFFENDWPDGVTYDRFIQAYNTIGATHSATCLADVITQMFGDKHDMDVYSRRKILDRWDVEKSSLLNDYSRQFLGNRREMDRLIAEYIAANDFYFVKGDENSP